MKEKLEFFEGFFPHRNSPKIPGFAAATNAPSPSRNSWNLWIFGKKVKKKFGINSQNPPQKILKSQSQIPKNSILPRIPQFFLNFFPQNSLFLFPKFFLKFPNLSLNFPFLYNFVFFSHNSPNFPRISLFIPQFFPKFP